MKTIAALFLVTFAVAQAANAQYGSPQVYSQNGTYLGNYNRNRYDPNSVSSPYGMYGSRYSPTSINNPNSMYGRQFSPHGARNRFGSSSSPQVYGADGTYLGRVNANRYDPQSISNPYGTYGSKYSPTSVNNPYSQYGSRYSINSANNPSSNGRGLVGHLKGLFHSRNSNSTTATAPGTD